MKTCAKLLSLVLTLCLVLSALGPRAAAAPVIVDSGECGDSAAWTLDSAGTLTISGSGRMTSFKGAPPWYLNRDDVRTVVVEPGITTVGQAAFSQCGSLTRVRLPDSLEKIEQSAFSGCGKLAEIRIPDSVTSLGNFAFGNCSSLRRVTLSSRLSSLPTQAFYNCRALEEIALPDSVEQIGDWAFQSCRSLRRADLGNGVTRLGANAFLDCGNLLTVTAGNALKEIDKMAFGRCAKLKTVTVGSGLERMDDDVFNNCASLTEIVLPGSLSQLGRWVFPGSLTDVWFGGTEAQWADVIKTTVPYGYNEALEKAEIHFIHILSFDAGGGSGSMAPAVAEPGDEVLLPENGFAPPAGMTFAGWSCGGLDCQPGDTLKADGSKTVTARWAPNQYTLTFDAAGGSPVDPIAGDFGSAVAAPADPVREGYAFAGWDPALPETMPAEDLTLTARWTAAAPLLKEITRDGDTVTAEAVLPESFPITEPAAVWCAVYDGEDRMLEALRGEPGGEQPLSFRFGDAGFASAKVFLLDGGGAPLCAPASLPPS